MKKIVIVSILVSILMMGIVHARIVWGEYVTKQEVRAYYASMSQLLDYYNSAYIRGLLDKNPMMKQQKEEYQYKLELQEEEKKAGR